MQNGLPKFVNGSRWNWTLVNSNHWGTMFHSNHWTTTFHSNHWAVTPHSNHWAVMPHSNNTFYKLVCTNGHTRLHDTINCDLHTWVSHMVTQHCPLQPTHLSLVTFVEPSASWWTYPVDLGPVVRRSSVDCHKVSVPCDVSCHPRPPNCRVAASCCHWQTVGCAKWTVSACHP